MPAARLRCLLLFLTPKDAKTGSERQERRENPPDRTITHVFYLGLTKPPLTRHRRTHPYISNARHLACEVSGVFYCPRLTPARSFRGRPPRGRFAVSPAGKRNRAKSAIC